MNHERIKKLISELPGVCDAAKVKIEDIFKEIGYIPPVEKKEPKPYEIWRNSKKSELELFEILPPREGKKEKFAYRYFKWKNEGDTSGGNCIIAAIDTYELFASCWSDAIEKIINLRLFQLT